MLTILTPATTNHLTSVDRVKTELSITGSAEDAKILSFISEASGLVTAYCGRNTFGVQTVRQTERLSCSRDCIIMALDLDPGIDSVTVDGTALAGTEYELDGSLLYRLDASDKRVAWDGGTKVVIEYDAGFVLLTTLPEAIERAAIDLVVGMYRGAGRDMAVRQEVVEGIGSTSYLGTSAGSVPLSAERLVALQRFRLVSIG